MPFRFSCVRCGAKGLGTLDAHLRYDCPHRSFVAPIGLPTHIVACVICRKPATQVCPDCKEQLHHRSTTGWVTGCAVEHDAQVHGRRWIAKDGPGEVEVAADNAQADAAAADFDATPEDAKPAVNPEVPW